MNCSLPGSSVHGILQARVLELVAIFYSRGYVRPRDWTCISCTSCIDRQILFHCASWETLQMASRSWKGKDTDTPEGNPALITHSPVWSTPELQDNKCVLFPATFVVIFNTINRKLTHSQLKSEHTEGRRRPLHFFTRPMPGSTPPRMHCGLSKCLLCGCRLVPGNWGAQSQPLCLAVTPSEPSDALLGSHPGPLLPTFFCAPVLTLGNFC